MARFTPVSAITEQPQSILVWGRHPLAVDLTALGFAHAIDPDLLWLEPQELPGRPPEWESDAPHRTLEHWQVRRFPTDVPELDQSTGDLAAYVGASRTASGGLPGSYGAATDLPFVVRRAVEEVGSPSHLRAIVLAGADSLGPTWWNGFLGSEACLRELTLHGVSCVVSWVGQPPDSIKEAFSFVFRVEPEPGRHWVDSSLVAERRAAPGPIGIGQPIPARWSSAFEWAMERWAASFFERPEIPPEASEAFAF